MHQAKPQSLKPFFEPRAIAIVGVSKKEGSLGREILTAIRKERFLGRVVAVNPHLDRLGEETVYPSLEAIPSEIDLAVLVVPRGAFLEALEACERKGVKAVVAITSGFGELGADGRREESKIRQILTRSGMRLLGPNCMGVMNTAVALNATFSPVFPPVGNIALASQSGSFGQGVVEYARSLGVGISSFVSLGNRLDLSECDLLEHWENDPATKVILLYLESFSDVERFVQTAQRVRRKKPIIALHGGRTDAGRRAVASHTGSLAGRAEVIAAVYRKAGILLVESFDELLGVAQLVATEPLPKGKRVAVITNAGGPGILAADRLVRGGLTVVPPSKEAMANLRAFLPREASVTNPVDLIASATADDFVRALEILYEDPDNDAVLVNFICPSNRSAPDVMGRILEKVKALSAAGVRKKPIALCFIQGSGRKHLLDLLEKFHLPIFSFPEQAADALVRFVALAELAKQKGSPTARRPTKKSLSLAKGWLEPQTIAELLHRYKIPATPQRIAADWEGVRRAARALKYPVVLKAYGPALVHKTESGAVAVNLCTEKDLRAAFLAMSRSLKRARQKPQGYLVQKMIEGGVEIVVGGTFEPGYGHVAMVGLGGVLVEILNDVRFALFPVNRSEARQMIRSLKAFRLLTGYRGAKPSDLAALEEVIVGVSNLLIDHPEITEIDFNPMRLSARGKGCLALDARILVRSCN